jgi:hypothetical protein
MAIGRISGPLLKANLIRNGIDLAFETDLLYLDVNNQRIGIKTITPQHELDINGTTRTTNLLVTNRADIGNVNIVGNTISSDGLYLNLGTFDNVVYQNKLRIDSIDLEGNVISTNDSNANLEFRPNGTGSVDVYSNMNVTGNIHATGNISADGNITLGDANTDNVVFNAEVASDIIPDQTDTYVLGSTEKRWNNLWVKNIVTDNLSAGDLVVDGIDLALRQGNIYYVSELGNDVNTGDHPQGPFRTLKHALNQSTSGDTVYLYPGVYEEAFPLTIPVGVTVKGHSIRGVKIVPTLATQTNDVFLLNGESTIEDITIADFYSPGYAFKFAPGFTVTTRSPYIRNLSVITKGSVTTSEDPRGFNAGDAGKGAYLDGSVATVASNEASCLFHSVTFITPGVDAIEMTNGVRVEWLNSFTYFANRSMYAYDGASGIKGTGETALRVDGLTGSYSAGETVTYYDTDGTTVLVSATILRVDADGKLYLSGKQSGFQTALARGGKTITANGNAKLSTAVKKFGTASLELDGTGDYAFVQASPDFAYGTDDFTIEMWVYRTVSGITQVLLDQRTAAPTNFAPVVFINTSNTLGYVNGAASVITGANTVPLNTWSHVALSRNGTSTRLFLNGVQEGITYTDANNYIQTPVTIGARFNNIQNFTGYIDDLRIIKGVGLYTANFTAPTTRALVTPETVLMARFDGENNSTTFTDDVVYAQDIRFSGGATATRITLTDFTDFGAEVRLIGSASVYGNFGLVGDGPGVIMYAIGQNLAYIGNGKEVTNDPETVIQGNEVVESNGAKIRYNSVDHKGDFRVGDLFYVNQEAGTVDFTVSNFTINTEDGVTFVTNGDTTFIDGTKIETGNWRISGNTVETLTGDANIDAASGEINLNSDVNINGSLDVTGNVTIGGNIQIGDEATDTIQIVAGIDSDIIPREPSKYGLGTATKTWANLYVNEINLDSIQIRDNYIQTVDSNADLELRANGTGKILVPTNNVEIDNDLTVNGVTNLKDTNITGAITHVGNTTQTGNYTITGQLTNGDILINDNVITTTVSNSNLELRANGTGTILIPSNNVVIEQGLTVNSVTNLSNTNITGIIVIEGDTTQTGNMLITQDFNIGQNLTVGASAQFEEILIDDNFITSTSSNTDLELRANGTGKVLIPNNDLEITNNLTVGLNILANTITVTDTITSNIFSTGDIEISNNYITTTLSNSNLELRASGSGKILIPLNDVEVSNTLSVIGATSLQDTTIAGNVTHIGNTVQTGNIDVTGNLNITGDVTISGTAQFENIEINDNVIKTTLSNSDLELRATEFGDILIPENDVVISNDLFVGGTITVGDINSIGTITANRFTTGNILIDDNFITTTLSNSDLELRANGTGEIVIPSNNVTLDQSLTVNGDTSLKNVSIVGDILQTGNITQTGNFSIDGDLSITGKIDILDSIVQFENIQILGNRIATTESNSDLELRANGTGEIVVPNNDVVISNNLTIAGTLNVGNIFSTALISANNFTTGNILIDDNFITTTLSNSDLELRANGTGSVVIKEFSINDNVISSESNIILNPGSEQVIIDATGALKLPVGTTLERPLAQVGQVRYNSELLRFEGYNGTNWINLKGVEDVDGDTRISAELTEGANDNIIRFYVAGSQIVSIDNAKLSAPRIDVDDIRIDGNVISTTTNNTNLILSPAGTGGVIIDNFEIKNNSIRNTVSNSITLFENTNNGYVKFAGSYGVVLPVGTSGTRPPIDFVETGQIRYNTTDFRVEIWDGGNWVSVAGAASGITRNEAENIAFEIALSLG